MRESSAVEIDARLTEGSIWSSSLRFGLPLALAMAAHGLFNCIDLVIVGRLGEGAVAAVTLGGIINMVAMLAYNGVANVLAGMAASLRGAGDLSGLESLRRLSFRLTLVASLVLGLGFALLARPLIALVGTDPATENLATEYLVICSLGSGTMFFVLWATSILRADGESFWPTTVLIGSNVLNLIFDFILVFGLLGCPKLGVAGAAWATVLARLIGAVTLFVVIRMKPTQPRVGGSERAFLRELLWKGFMNSAQTITRVLGLYAILSLAARGLTEGGEIAARDFVDGIGVAIRLEMVLMFTALGFGAAAASFAGQNLGAGKLDRLQEGLRIYSLQAILLVSIAALGLWIYQAELFQFIAPESASAAARYGRGYLLLILPVQPALIFSILISQALVGIGSVRTAVLIDSLLYLVLAPAVVAFLGGGSSRSFVTLALIHVLASLVYLVIARIRFGKASLGQKQNLHP